MDGTVRGISGATVQVALDGLRIGDRVKVGLESLTGEVVRLEGGTATVQVFEENRGLGVGEPAASAGGPLTVQLGPGLLGGIYDGLQRPLSGLRAASGDFISAGSSRPALETTRRFRLETPLCSGSPVGEGEQFGLVREGHIAHPLFAPAPGEFAGTAGEWRLDQPLGRLTDGRPLLGWQAWPVRTPRPFRRKLPLTHPLVTGQRCIDLLFPLLKGGVTIIPGGFGTGKTVLEQTIAKFADVDVVVYVGCGERGNEMAGLLDEFSQLEDPRTGRPLSERTIIVANTSNMPVAARESSIFTAVSMAEYYRDLGLDVLFLADSLSRWAEALREISSALEEMPGEDGYPTYLNSRLAGFMERAGVVETLAGQHGSLSMILSVSPPGGDFSEPVTQACLRVGGALLMLDTGLANRRHYPAINWTHSYSLYAGEATRHFAASHPRWPRLREECRSLLQREESLREVAEVVGMEGLQESDRLVMRTAERVRLDFLCQNSFSEDAYAEPGDTVARIERLIDEHDRLLARLGDGLPLGQVLREAADATG